MICNHPTVTCFLTLCYFQGYLLYGYGGKKLYEYSVFKPLEGYFK